MDKYTINELKKNLKAYCDAHLQKTRTKNFYICPYCSSGAKKHRSPAFHLFPDNMPTQYRCASCGETGDIFRLVQDVEHLANFSEALRRVNDLYGNPDDMKPVPVVRNHRNHPGTRGKPISRMMNSVPIRTAPIRTEPETPPEQWQNAMMNISRNAESRIFTDAGISARNYLFSRGLDEQTIREYHVGFLALDAGQGWMRDHGYSIMMETPLPDDEKQRLAIPAGISFPYIMNGKVCKLETRRTPDQLAVMQDHDDKIGQVRGCRKALFNSQDAECQDKRRDIIFTEGVIDALSINQAVGRNCNDEIKAVTFGSATTHGDPDEFFQWYVMPYRIAVGFDNDEPGKTNSLKLAELINQARKKAGRPNVIRIFPPEQYNDWNEFLMKDSRSVFRWISNCFPVDE